MFGGRRIATPLLVVVVLGFSACGEGAGKGTTTLSPTQYDNAQQIDGYILALRKVEAPFAQPPTEPTNLRKARRLLEAAIQEVASLTPPEQFTMIQAKILRGERGELAALEAMERARDAHDAVGINNAEARNIEAEHVVRDALGEGNAVLAKCKRDNFSC